MLLFMFWMNFVCAQQSILESIVSNFVLRGITLKLSKQYYNVLYLYHLEKLYSDKTRVTTCLILSLSFPRGWSRNPFYLHFDCCFQCKTANASSQRNHWAQQTQSKRQTTRGPKQRHGQWKWKTIADPENRKPEERHGPKTIGN